MPTAEKIDRLRRLAEGSTFAGERAAARAALDRLGAQPHPDMARDQEPFDFFRQVVIVDIEVSYSDELERQLAVRIGRRFSLRLGRRRAKPAGRRKRSTNWRKVIVYVGDEDAVRSAVALYSVVRNELRAAAWWMKAGFVAGFTPEGLSFEAMAIKANNAGHRGSFLEGAVKGQQVLATKGGG